MCAAPPHVAAGARRDHGTNVTSPQISKDRSVAGGLRPPGTWTAWSDGLLGWAEACGLQGLLEHRHLVPLPGRERKAERQACTIAHRVDLGAEAAAREAECMVVRLLRIPFLRAPAAARLARTEGLSMHHRSKSISPSQRHRVSRADGLPRPVTLREITLLRTGAQLPHQPVHHLPVVPPAPPPCPPALGMRSAISSHCASRSSCRRIARLRPDGSHQGNRQILMQVHRPSDRI